MPSTAARLPHVHETHTDVVNRLKRAGGHQQTIIAMVEGGRDCLDLAQQLQAVLKAVEGAKSLLIMVAPMMSDKNPFLKDMKSKYGAVTIGFSGWAQSSRFAFGRRSDYSIPMSDHCDFNELVDLVIRSVAEQVYTIHGFVEEFAAHLRKIGINPQPLRENSLDDFI